MQRTHFFSLSKKGYILYDSSYIIFLNDNIREEENKWLPESGVGGRKGETGVGITQKTREIESSDGGINARQAQSSEFYWRKHQVKSQPKSQRASNHY